MQSGVDLDVLIAALAKKVAAQVREELAGDAVASITPRLLTVEQAATYMGRTEEAMQHMVANGKVPTVRIDRRVFLDVRDLNGLIESYKTTAVR
jgi:hypothetical protein